MILIENTNLSRIDHTIYVPRVKSGWDHDSSGYLPF